MQGDGGLVVTVLGRLAACDGVSTLCTIRETGNRTLLLEILGAVSMNWLQEYNLELSRLMHVHCYTGNVQAWRPSFGSSFLLGTAEVTIVIWRYQGKPLWLFPGFPTLLC